MPSSVVKIWVFFVLDIKRWGDEISEKRSARPFSPVVPADQMHLIVGKKQQLTVEFRFWQRNEGNPLFG
jgi:hypothetical protein